MTVVLRGSLLGRSRRRFSVQAVSRLGPSFSTTAALYPVPLHRTLEATGLLGRPPRLCPKTALVACPLCQILLRSWSRGQSRMLPSWRPSDGDGVPPRAGRRLCSGRPCCHCGVDFLAGSCDPVVSALLVHAATAASVSPASRRSRGGSQPASDAQGTQERSSVPKYGLSSD